MFTIRYRAMGTLACSGILPGNRLALAKLYRATYQFIIACTFIQPSSTDANRRDTVDTWLSLIVLVLSSCSRVRTRWGMSRDQ